MLSDCRGKQHCITCTTHSRAGLCCSGKRCCTELGAFLLNAPFLIAIGQSQPGWKQSRKFFSQLTLKLQNTYNSPADWSIKLPHKILYGAEKQQKQKYIYISQKPRRGKKKKKKKKEVCVFLSSAAKRKLQAEGFLQVVQQIPQVTLQVRRGWRMVRRGCGMQWAFSPPSARRAQRWALPRHAGAGASLFCHKNGCAHM